MQRRAWVTGTVAVLVLVALALPLFSMRLAFTDAGNDPTSLTTRQAYDLLAQGFGPGFNGPLVVAADMHGPSDRADRRPPAAGDRRAPRGVAFVTPPQFNAADTGAVIIVYPTTSPQSAQTETLVQTLRNDVIPPVVGGTDVDAQVGGETAASIDAANFLGHRLFLVIGAVLILSFLLLMVVFRSLVLPLKAVIMNLLSVGAAYGVMVAVFQWGWAGRVIGIGETGPIDPWIPVALFVVLFGLSMDYEVFLLSRIREEWLRTQRQLAGRGRRAGRDRAHHHRGGGHHVLRLRLVRDQGPAAHPQGLRPGAGHRRAGRRHAGAHGARPVDHGAPRAGQLVDAALDGPLDPDHRRRGDADAVAVPTPVRCPSPA